MATIEKLREEATCSVCLEYFKDPVSLDCGHNFCRACISQCWGPWGRAERSYACPQCRQAIPQRNFQTNRSLKNVVELVQNLRLEAPEAPPGEKGVCKRHQEPLKLFCRNDETPICVICRESRDHQSHVVHPIEEAAQDYKEEIQSELQKLKNERESLKGKQLEGQAAIEVHLKTIEVEWNTVVSEFEQLHQFEQEQKNLFLGKLKELQKEVEDEQASKETNLSEEIGRLNALIGEMEEIWQQPGSEFLQDIKCLLRRDTTPSATSHQEITGNLPLQAVGFNSYSRELCNQMCSVPNPFVKIGPPLALGPSVKIGPPLALGPSVKIGPPLALGPSLKIGPSSALGPSLKIGPSSALGPSVMIGPSDQSSIVKISPLARTPFMKSGSSTQPTIWRPKPRWTIIQEPVTNSDLEQRLNAFTQMNMALRGTLAQFKGTVASLIDQYGKSQMNMPPQTRDDTGWEPWGPCDF